MRRRKWTKIPAGEEGEAERAVDEWDCGNGLRILKFDPLVVRNSNDRSADRTSAKFRVI